MTTDSLLNLVLSVVVPGLMALAGGILAARSLPREEGKRNPEVLIWSSGFLCLWLVSIVLAVWQQVRTTTKDQAVEKTAHEKDLRSNGETKYMQGQLDSINVVLATLSKNSDPHQTAAIIQSILPITRARPDDVTRPLSNKEVSARAIALAQEMRIFDHEYQDKSTLIYRQQTNTTAEWQSKMAQIESLSSQTQFEFRSRFLGDALSLKEEMENRLHYQPSEEDKRKFIAFKGGLAGPTPISDAADYLETLAHKLAPT